MPNDAMAKKPGSTEHGDRVLIRGRHCRLVCLSAPFTVVTHSPEVGWLSLFLLPRFPVMSKSFPVNFQRQLFRKTRMDAGFVGYRINICTPDLQSSLYFSLLAGNLGVPPPTLRADLPKTIGLDW
jgi:hypothetical protein